MSFYLSPLWQCMLMWYVKVHIYSNRNFFRKIYAVIVALRKVISGHCSGTNIHQLNPFWRTSKRKSCDGIFVGHCAQKWMSYIFWVYWHQVSWRYDLNAEAYAHSKQEQTISLAAVDVHSKKSIYFSLDDFFFCVYLLTSLCSFREKPTSHYCIFYIFLYEGSCNTTASIRRVKWIITSRLSVYCL